MSLGFLSKRYQENCLNLDLKAIHSGVPRYNPQVKFKRSWKEPWYTAARRMVPDLNRKLWLLSGKLLTTFHTNLSSMLACPIVWNCTAPVHRIFKLLLTSWCKEHLEASIFINMNFSIGETTTFVQIQVGFKEISKRKETNRDFMLTVQYWSRD